MARGNIDPALSTGPSKPSGEAVAKETNESGSNQKGDVQLLLRLPSGDRVRGRVLSILDNKTRMRKVHNLDI